MDHVLGGGAVIVGTGSFICCHCLWAARGRVWSCCRGGRRGRNVFNCGVIVWRCVEVQTYPDRVGDVGCDRVVAFVGFALFR